MSKTWQSRSVRLRCHRVHAKFSLVLWLHGDCTVLLLHCNTARFLTGGSITDDFIGRAAPSNLKLRRARVDQSNVVWMSFKTHTGSLFQFSWGSQSFQRHQICQAEFWENESMSWCSSNFKDAWRSSVEDVRGSTGIWYSCFHSCPITWK